MIEKGDSGTAGEEQSSKTCRACVTIFGVGNFVYLQEVKNAAGRCRKTVETQPLIILITCRGGLSGISCSCIDDLEPCPKDEAGSSLVLEHTEAMSG